MQDFYHQPQEARLFGFGFLGFELEVPPRAGQKVEEPGGSKDVGTVDDMGLSED